MDNAMPASAPVERGAFGDELVATFGGRVVGAYVRGVLTVRATSREIPFGYDGPLPVRREPRCGFGCIDATRCPDCGEREESVESDDDADDSAVAS